MNYLYNKDWKSIPLPSITGETVVTAVKDLNNYFQTIEKDFFVGLSKTTISTLFTDKLPLYIARLEPTVKLNPAEKGYPDLLPSKSSIIKEHNLGENVKVSVNFNVSAHHNNTSYILYGHWFEENGICYIGFVGSIMASKDNWSNKPNTDNNQNTPATNLSKKFMKSQTPVVWCEKDLKIRSFFSFPELGNKFWTLF